MSISSQRSLDYDISQAGNGDDTPTIIIENDGGEKQCPHCNQWYNGISYHWSRSPDCSYPPITKYKHEIFRGMMLGDGYVTSEGRFGVGMVNHSFMEWLSSELDWLIPSVKKQKTNADAATHAADSLGFETTKDACYDYYRLNARTHPEITKYRAWYDDGDMVFPSDIEITPTILKLWYVSDGNLYFDQRWENSTTRVNIGSINESSRPEQGLSYLESVDIDATHSGGKFRIAAHDTENFFEYIGDPVPGFDHKWSWEDCDEYKRLCEKRDELHRTQTVT